MTPAEAQTLLGIAASFDNRKPNEEAAIAWSHALGDLPFADCRDAIVAHYRASSDWLTPAKVIAEVKRIRSKRLEDAPPLTPPPGLDPIATNEWLREKRRLIADGQTVDCDAAYGELKPRNLPDLRALARKVDERAELTVPASSPVPVTHPEESS